MSKVNTHGIEAELRVDVPAEAVKASTEKAEQARADEQAGRVERLERRAEEGRDNG